MNKSILDYYNYLDQDGVVFYFNGPVSHSVLEGFGDIIRQNVATSKSDTNLARKVFAVMVEQMQNIIAYSIDKKEAAADASCGAGQPPSEYTYGTGQILVQREEDGFIVACSNRITTQQAERIRQKVEQINAMSKTELKDYYRRQRKAGPDKESMGAGLGFIEMARKAKKPLAIDFSPLDDTASLFSVTVNV